MNRLTLFLIVWLTFLIVPCHADLGKPADTKIAPEILPIPKVTTVSNESVLKSLELAPITDKGSSLQLYQNKKSVRQYGDFLSYVSSKEYSIRKKVVLVKAHTTRLKQTIMFVFFMNKPSKQGSEQDLVKRHRRMHIMWPGSKRALAEQKIIDDEYPVDVSIDNYSEGFAPGEWNLALPSKKPRSVAVAFLWAF